MKYAEVGPFKSTDVGIVHGKGQTRSILHDWWLREVLGATVCVVSTVVIVMLLAMYDGKSLPIWPLSITVNSFVSVLSTIAKVCLVRIPSSIQVSCNLSLNVYLAG